jgi:hypothetical protein
MEISLGVAGPALVVPADAVESESHGATTLSFVWVATATPSGDSTVERRPIEVIARSGSNVAVKSGIQAGDKVVVSPQGLVAGGKVRPVAADTAAAASSDQTILVDDKGYNPSTITIPAGAPAHLKFVRKVEDTCATSVHFGELGIQADTPLNKPVMVDIPAQAAGKQLTFACPMDMYKGTVMVK